MDLRKSALNLYFMLTTSWLVYKPIWQSANVLNASTEFGWTHQFGFQTLYCLQTLMFEIITYRLEIKPPFAVLLLFCSASMKVSVKQAVSCSTSLNHAFPRHIVFVFDLLLGCCRLFMRTAIFQINDILGNMLEPIFVFSFCGRFGVFCCSGWLTAITCLIED